MLGKRQNQCKAKNVHQICTYGIEIPDSNTVHNYKHRPCAANDRHCKTKSASLDDRDMFAIQQHATKCHDRDNNATQRSQRIKDVICCVVWP